MQRFFKFNLTNEREEGERWGGGLHDFQCNITASYIARMMRNLMTDHLNCRASISVDDVMSMSR